MDDESREPVAAERDDPSFFAYLGLFAAYAGGSALLFNVLWMTPPAGWTRLNGVLALYGLLGALGLALVVGVASARGWSGLWTLAVGAPLVLGPGALLNVNVMADSSEEQRAAEVIGTTTDRGGRASVPAWFLIVRDDQGEEWPVVVGEEWITRISIGSVGTLRIHTGLFGIRWVDLHDVNAPDGS